jgi:hypothetical protein
MSDTDVQHLLMAAVKQSIAHHLHGDHYCY